MYIFWNTYWCSLTLWITSTEVNLAPWYQWSTINRTHQVVKIWQAFFISIHSILFLLHSTFMTSIRIANILSAWRNGVELLSSWKYPISYPFKCKIRNNWYDVFVVVVVVVCGLTSHSAIFQLYSDGTDVQFQNFDLLPGTHAMGS